MMEHILDIIKTIGAILVVITPIAVWIKWSIKKWVKDNGHCCLKNGCLTQFKRVMKDVIKKEVNK